jgi:hypothetical protein
MTPELEAEKKDLN